MSKGTWLLTPCSKMKERDEPENKLLSFGAGLGRNVNALQSRKHSQRNKRPGKRSDPGRCQKMWSRVKTELAGKRRRPFVRAPGTLRWCFTDLLREVNILLRILGAYLATCKPYFFFFFLRKRKRKSYCFASKGKTQGLLSQRL